MHARIALKLFTILINVVFLAAAACASSEEVAFQFGPNTGSHPASGLIRDAAGNFYGTTDTGFGHGAVYKLSPNPDGTWSETVLYKFKGRGAGDGGFPWAPLTFDSSGNLFGTTAFDGSNDCACGVVFKLTPNGDGTWSEQVLYVFTGKDDGAHPYAGVTLDSAGNIYGVASGGGTYDHGTVFQLTPRPDGTYGGKVLHQFSGGRDGAQPMGRLTFDDKGNLFGTTAGGGADSAGTVFALSPQGNRWQETVVYHFQTTPFQNGFYPYGGVTFDRAGNLYGTTYLGGKGQRGTVFELTPTPRGPWKAAVLLNFDRFRDSGGPRTDLVFDAAGNLYGTATGFVGGPESPGSVFELTPNGNGWTETVLWNFQGEHRGRLNLYGNVAFDDAGNIYGTTFQGEDPDCGFVYKITR